MANFDLAGKVAYINGGAKGIGGKTSLSLAQQGATVVIGDINAQGAAQTAAQITDNGGEALALNGDCSERDVINSNISKTKEAFGRVDIAVNIVGRATREGEPDFWEENDEDWDWMYRVNLKSQYYLVQAVSEIMQDQEYGKIVLVAADLGRTGGFAMRNPTTYVALKAGVIAFTKSVARDLGEYNISVNCVSPGYTQQPDREGAKDVSGELPEVAKMFIPMRRLAEPEEQADAITFLCTPASDFITGQVISVNGGADMVD